MASVLPYRPNTNSGSTTASTASKRVPSLASKRSVSNQSVPQYPSQQTIVPRSAHGSHNSANSGPQSPAQFTFPRKRRKVKPQYPANSEEKHVEYILVASFDIDRGSIMEHQYPGPIGGDEHMLAELMLPDQTHMRSQDWTVFFLHKDTTEEEPPQPPKDKKRRKKQEGRNGEQPTENGSGSDESESDDDVVDTVEGPPLVYVLNLVNTKQDNTVKRGAIVKAMAICTRHSFLHIYKPLLLLALEEYFKSPFPETLAQLYNAVNSMDLSLLPRLSFYEQFILQASDVKDLFIEKFGAMIQQRMSQSNAEDRANQPTSIMQGRQRYGLPRDTHEFESIVPYNNIPVPIKIPTALSPETVGDFSLIKLIQTFSTPHTTSAQPFTNQHPHLTTSGPLTHPIIVLLNALLTQKRVIFIGHNLPSSEVAEAVLAACALASGGLLRGFTRHAFPYTDLTKIDDLLKVPGFIAGVTNPAFAQHTEWWDLSCDLGTGRMKISPKIEPAPLTEGVLFFSQTGPHSAAALLHSSSAEAKSISALATAGATLSAGLGGTSFPVATSGVGDPTGDSAFMLGVLTAIAERRGEAAIRAKFRLWIVRFTRLAAALEETVYGASALHVHAPSLSNETESPITPKSDFADLDPAIAGHGYVWPSTDLKLRELAANATRIEGWSKTRSYYNFIQDLASTYSHRPVKSLDLQHLHDKLTKLRLGPDASAAIYLALAASVQSYEQINQLLATMMNASSAAGTGAGMGSAAGGNGLFYLALGLFHPRVDVREATAELLGRIREHEAGRHFWARLGGFEKKAWEKVVEGREKRELE